MAKKIKLCADKECVEIKKGETLLRGRDYPAYAEGKGEFKGQLVKMHLAMDKKEALEWFSEEEIKEHQKKKLPFTGSLP